MFYRDCFCSLDTHGWDYSWHFGGHSTGMVTVLSSGRMRDLVSGQANPRFGRSRSKSDTERTRDALRSQFPPLALPPPNASSQLTRLVSIDSREKVQLRRRAHDVAIAMLFPKEVVDCGCEAKTGSSRRTRTGCSLITKAQTWQVLSVVGKGWEEEERKSGFHKLGRARVIVVLSTVSTFFFSFFQNHLIRSCLPR